MEPICRLLMAGVVVISAGCLTSCSGTDTQQNPPLPTSTSLTLQTVTTNLTSPVFMTAPSNDRTRLFIVEQGGLIQIFDVTTNSLLATPFLNISNLLPTAAARGEEQGLLGLAFHPQYATNLQFYVFYTDTSGNIVIARYFTTAANPNLADATSADPLLTVAHPNFSNHNGGMLAFGPDGCLYAGIGDGGGSGDPNDNGQHLTTVSESCCGSIPPPADPVPLVSLPTHS